MSVEKLSNDSKTKREKIPFTMICNNVICHIKNSDSFLVWSYMLSKSSNWKVIKKHLKKKFKFGDTKIKRIFSYMNRSNLIKYVQRIGSNGTFEPMDIIVQTGSKFDKNQPFIQDGPVGQKTARAVNRTDGNGGLLNKDIKQNKEKELKTKRYCPSDDERKSFEQFWLLYPRKQKRKNAFEIWLKNKLHSKSDEINLHLMKRTETEWKGKSKNFIPLPTTFLNSEGWYDEIITNQNVVPMKVNTSQHNRNVNYVMEKLKNGC